MSSRSYLALIALLSGLVICCMSLILPIWSEKLDTNRPDILQQERSLFRRLQSVAKQNLPSWSSLATTANLADARKAWREDQARLTSEVRARLDASMPLPRHILARKTSPAFLRTATTQSLASLTPDQVMNQLNDVDSQQHHFRFSKPAPAVASAQLPKLSQQPYPPALISPYGAPPPALAAYGGYPRLRTRGVRIPLPPMPPLARQLDTIEGMQGRYQFAPERDALYSGQGFRQAAQDSYDGVYQ
eukprot:CAMPEP_0172183782 /NCGR_PEP_ID=MMETSP1050-20130122/19188_1 /TAXON_ID=233186 /ORGANISM="Cryptomonas curvata, Strain CCAP979/52" /LENGTH=245 /DNA_ID=CAMNT_0012857461 /DNA_START=45 /DNA_END=779 /DNA_ORIENTATION=+